jgi:glycerol-3-phosphate dehydrogenase (NAD(P)+)
MSSFSKIGVCGGGSWGTALACQVARCQKNAILFLRDEQVMREIKHHHTNSKYFGDVLLPANIEPTNDLRDIIDHELIIIAVPSNSLVGLLQEMKDTGLDSKTVLLIATKGLSSNPAQFFADKIKMMLPNQLGFISGPNFASEVVQDLLTMATIGCSNLKLAERISASLASKNFRLSVTDDIITMQIAGAVKNIIAIKSGMYEAIGHKENARAGLIAQGAKEIAVLSRFFGGKIDTLFEPAVLGDLVLTCSSKTSRNNKFGYELAQQNGDVDQFLKNYPHLVEGVESTKLILKLIGKNDLDLPIIFSVAKILNLLQLR